MKIRSRKWFALLLAMLMLAMTAACSLEDKPAEGGVYSEKERAWVAATVGGKYDITKGELVDRYNEMLQMYSAYGMGTPTADADVETMQDGALQSLVSANILLYEAEERGLALDAEETAEVDAEVDEEMQYWIDQFAAQAQSEGAANIEARTKELFDKALADSDMNMDMEGYRAYIRDSLMDQALATKLEETIKAEVSITEEEIQAYYDHLLEIQKEAYSATPADYRSDAEAYEMNGGNPVVYAPRGYMRVKTITVSPEGEIDAEHTTLRSELEALEAEYGRLMLEDAELNAERLAEIKTEYDEKKVKADAMYAAYIEDAQEKINEAYAALQAGESFDVVLEDFGEDDIYKTYPAFMEKGILMLKKDEASMDAALVEAALALEQGAYSEVIQVGDMFYIIMPVGDEPNGTVPLEQVYDVIKEMATAEAAEAFWTEQQEQWNNDTTLVVYHEDVYRDIGKSN